MNQLPHLSRASFLCFALCLASGTPLLGSGALLQPNAEASEDSHQAQELDTTEKHGQSNGLIYKVINFAILISALAYLLRKPLSGFLAQRTSEIQADLEKGRNALEESNARLKRVEEKMKGMEDVITGLRTEAEKEERAELSRLRKAAKVEADRIMGAAKEEIEGAGRAARLDLKRYAVNQAIRLAEEHLRQNLNKKQNIALVERFLTKLEKSPEVKT